MHTMAEMKLPIHSVFWPKRASYLTQTFIIAMGVAFLTFAAQLRIPTLPVPITFQSSAVILIAMAYGAKNGTYAVATYLIAGLCGLPVFEDFSGGFKHVFGPTLGYLIGFLPAAYVSGYLAEHGFARYIMGSFAAACIGTAIIFLFGVSFLALTIGWPNAVALGLMPFIISEPIKLAFVALLIPQVWREQ